MFGYILMLYVYMYMCSWNYSFGFVQPKIHTLARLWILS